MRTPLLFLAILLLVLVALPAAALERLATIPGTADQNAFYLNSSYDMNGDGINDISTTAIVNTDGGGPTSNEACVRIYDGTGSLMWECVLGHPVIYQLCPDCAWNNPLQISSARFGEVVSVPDGREALIRWKGEGALGNTCGWALISTFSNAVVANFRGDSYYATPAFLANVAYDVNDEIVFVGADSTQVWGIPASSSTATPSFANPTLAVRGTPSNQPTVSFTTSSASQVTARLFTVSGREVRTLLSGAMEAGDHSICWDGLDDAGSPAPSGVYFAKVTTPAGESTTKLILAR
jgi:hypothetical protein